MNSFPGGFPGIYATESGATSSSSSTLQTRNFSDPSIGATTPNTTSSNGLPSLSGILFKSIKERKKVLRNELISNFDLLCFLYFALCYLYDCSLLVLFTRSLVQLSIMVLRYSPLLHGLFSSLSGKKPTFNLLILSTTFVIIFHLTTPLPKPNDDGFIYGHHTLQAIGQYQLSSKYWLLCYDLMIFFLQLTVFATQYSAKKSLHTKCTIRNSYDGFQGGINIIKIPVFEALNMERATFEELKEDERMAEQNNQRFARQLESLINSNDGELETEGTGYGSIDQRNSALGNF